MNDHLIGGFVSELEKISQDPTWWEKQKGVTRAMRVKEKGIGKIIAKPEIIKGRFKKGLEYGGIGAGATGALGAALGALLRRSGKGALAGGGLGALLGFTVGSDVGQYKHDVGYLKKRGITPKHLGLSAKFTPAAKKKYIETPMAKRLKELKA